MPIVGPWVVDLIMRLDQSETLAAGGSTFLVNTRIVV